MQTAAMLVRVTNDFAQSVIVLAEARNVKYKSFVKPGNVLQMSLVAKEIGTDNSSFVGSAEVDGEPMVEGRFKLRHFNLSDTKADLAPVDERITKEMKCRARLVGAC